MRALHPGSGRWRSGGWVRLLVVGGTRFAGRAFVEQAVGHGHEVTVFHRSVSEPEDFPSGEHLHGTETASLACCGAVAGMRCSTPAPTFPGRCGRPPAVMRDV